MIELMFGAVGKVRSSEIAEPENRGFRGGEHDASYEEMVHGLEAAHLRSKIIEIN